MERIAVRFSLSFWRVSEELMIVDSRHPELALPTEKLLLNILTALGYPRELPSAEIVQWPMIDAPHQDQGDTAARETLHAFLDAQFLLNPGRHLLLMGSDAAHYLLSGEQPYTDLLGSEQKLEEFDLTARITPSLTEMLQEPAKKAVTWQAIRGLRRG
ncbi:hypothetical protein [Halioxenophilus sp. WMMB6]|uniref:hypothetical protein n=1 Tax=Halioxenophilus sp. WMMB6 TaxID=3073815 RepID=UPI00295E4B3A|nr:hypothetical protein [Halioxenophilus sp. WMMB6]